MELLKPLRTGLRPSYATVRGKRGVFPERACGRRLTVGPFFVGGHVEEEKITVRMVRSIRVLADNTDGADDGFGFGCTSAGQSLSRIRCFDATMRSLNSLVAVGAMP